MLFILCSFLFIFLFFLFCISVLWACAEITHNAQPRKLTDSCVGQGVIRWRQYRDGASQLLWSHASAFPHVCYRHNSTALTRCLRHAGTRLTSTSTQARVALLLSGVTKGYIPHFTAYMPYWNAKYCLILCFSLTFVESWALHFTCWGLGQVLKTKSLLFTKSS